VGPSRTEHIMYTFKMLGDLDTEIGTVYTLLAILKLPFMQKVKIELIVVLSPLELMCSIEDSLF